MVSGKPGLVQLFKPRAVQMASDLFRLEPSPREGGLYAGWHLDFVFPELWKPMRATRFICDWKTVRLTRWSMLIGKITSWVKFTRLSPTGWS
jgi:hypothetical protein